MKPTNASSPWDGRRRILVVYPHLPHYRYGVFKRLAESKRVDVTFAAAAESGDSGIEVIPLEALNRETLKNRHFGPFLWQEGLLRILANSNWDAAIFLGDAKYLSTWVATLILRLKRVPVLYWTIGWHRPERGLKRILRIVFYRGANGLLLYGNTARSIGGDMGYPTGRMCVIGNSHTSSATIDGSQENKEQLLIAEAVESARPFLITAVGRLTAVKEFHTLLEAVAELGAEHRHVTVVIAGEGPERDRLRKRADELGVDLRLPGAVYSGTALARLYSHSSLSVIPGAAGLSVTQSLHHGVPVITHGDPYAQMPEHEAIIPGVNGDLYERGSVEGLARIIERWIQMPPGSRRAAARACVREVQTNWSSEGHARRLIDAVLSIREPELRRHPDDRQP